MSFGNQYWVRVRNRHGSIREDWGAFDYEDLPERIKDAIDECPEDGEWILSEDATGDRFRDLGDTETVVILVEGETA